MSDNWVEEFGFSKNPYSTKALTAQDGVLLLCGREEEEKWLNQQLLSNQSIPLLIGDNGVGKTSIANVVAYKLAQKYCEGERRFFSLILNKVPAANPSEMEMFEKYLYREILHLLLVQKDFLLTRNISELEIQTVTGNIIHDSVNDYWISWTVQEWLKKCFGYPYSGGIICIIDNLENCGTSPQVQEMLEKYRDTIFNITGILWILCGTKYSVNKAILSPKLSGHIAYIEVNPIIATLTPHLIEQRIKLYGNSSSDPPVTQKLFEYIYKEMNCQLRNALSLCIEFSEHLFNFPNLRGNTREIELQRWLKNKAAHLPKNEYEISEESWELFDNILRIGPEISNNDFELCDIHSEEDFNNRAKILIEKQLLHRIPTDEGYILRVTLDGSLVRFRRKSMKNF